VPFHLFTDMLLFSQFSEGLGRFTVKDIGNYAVPPD